ncbi:NAD(P)-dependent oxidoreductase [Actinomadura harenae]|uniref:NAD(P)-dependent oxidoreductase n=1 Tax=Actinomadura harenae TaxID=2483351 RepID=A0A3M2MB54_9ACTN|nr:NAD(P)-binding domain-containing protein [Actinomadura harenae]RMI47014.1 NAD(P)-dependent oxidoreductase [Actinomadura harenae]
MSTDTKKITLLGLGAMGTAIARTWLAAGYDLTVWNRTASRAEPLAAEGATVAASAAEAVAASPLVVVCLLDDASVGEALATADLTGKDLVNITTGTPEEARGRAAWAARRGASYLDGGIMAVPPMIGVPESGAYVFYSGSGALYETHREALAVPAATRYTGEDPGSASLHDVALLSAMTGLFAGISHAFALMRDTDVPPTRFAAPLVEFLTGMTGYAHGAAAQLEAGDYTLGVTSNLAMMVQANGTLLRTAEDQGVSAELIAPFMALMERRLAEGGGAEGTTGVIDLLKR